MTVSDHPIRAFVGGGREGARCDHGVAGVSSVKNLTATLDEFRHDGQDHEKRKEHGYRNPGGEVVSHGRAPNRGCIAVKQRARNRTPALLEM